MFLVAAIGTTAAAQPPRVISREEGESLLSRLRSDDRIVAVPDGMRLRPGEPVTLPGYIGLLVGGSAVGVLLNVTSATSRLTEDQSWVVTEVTATVKRVLYARKGQVEVGRPVSLTYLRGGEMKIGSVTVRAGVVPNVVPGRTYLAFLNRTDELFVPPLNFRDHDSNEWYAWVGLFEITRAQRVIDPARYCLPIADDYFPELVLHNARLDLVLNFIQEAWRQKD